MVNGHEGTTFTAEQGMLHKQEAGWCYATTQAVRQYTIIMPAILSIIGIKQINKDLTTPNNSLHGHRVFL
jgi:hypothetical protein